jgi:hypothetical protein
MSNYLTYQADEYKQLSLMDQFKSSDVMKNYTTFLFVDGTRNLNARDRPYDFYEYTGMLTQLFGEETRFAADSLSFTSFSDYQVYRSYKYRDYFERSPQYVIIIKKGSYDLSLPKQNQCYAHGFLNLFRLMLDERFNRDSFDRNIRNIVKLEYLKIG